MLNGSLTVMVTVVLTVPPGPVAVMMYVVSVVGETTRLPVVTPLGSPGNVWSSPPPVILMVDANLTWKFSVADWPRVIHAGVPLA